MKQGHRFVALINVPYDTEVGGAYVVARDFSLARAIERFEAKLGEPASGHEHELLRSLVADGLLVREPHEVLYLSTNGTMDTFDDAGDELA